MNRAASVLVVDDEPFARASVRVVLERLPGVARVEEAGSGAEAVAALRARAFGAVFLDVRMPDIDGFEVLRLLEGEALPPVVFVTALDDHAVEAFDAAAVDYVVKPFSDERLLRAGRRALRGAASSPREPARDRDPASVGLAIGRFVVHTRRRTCFVPVGQVDFIEAAGNYVTLVAGSKEHLVRSTLARLEAELHPAGFRRIHRSLVVNLARVAEIEREPSGDGTVVLRSGRRLRLSRRYKDRIPDLLA